MNGKVVVVMGAGSVDGGWGNGKACAVTYARAGAAVVCADHQLPRAEETVAIITGEGGRAVAVAADATHEADVRAVVSLATSEFGGLDVMHNNVGVGGSSGAADQIELEAWDREIAQNLTSAYLGIRCAVPALRARGGGVITNVSSSLAVRFLGHPTAAYTASKAAVEALTKTSAVSYGRDNIRVNCIRIGFSESPLVMRGLRDLTDEQRERALDKSRAKVPLRREHGDPFDVAEAARYLASDAAKYVSGVVLAVDGALEHSPL